MKKLVLGTAFAAALIAGTSAQGIGKDVLDWVDPFIGSGGTGHTTPAATHPYPTVKVSREWQKVVSQVAGYRLSTSTMKTTCLKLFQHNIVADHAHYC